MAALVLTASMAAASLAGCSKNTETKTETPKTTETADPSESSETSKTSETSKSLKVALCLSGAANDMGWCQSAYEGLKLLESDYGCETAYTENLTPDDIEAAFADYAANGFDVVIGHGYEFGDPAIEVAEQYPDTKFIVTEGEFPLTMLLPMSPNAKKAVTLWECLQQECQKAIRLVL